MGVCKYIALKIVDFFRAVVGATKHYGQTCNTINIITY